MGYLSKLNPFGKNEQEEEEEVDFSEWEEPEESEEEIGESEWEEEEFSEPEIQEWDSAYKFADDALQFYGFAGVNEWVKKAMVREINRSTLYRDRIKVGRQTMNLVNETVTEMNQLTGQNDKGYEELAHELESANRLIDEVEKFNDKEEQMVREITGVFGQFVDAYASRQQSGASGVNATTQTSQEEL